MHFLEPSFLLLLLLLPLLWRFPTPVKDSRHGALRTAVFALLLLALAQPVVTSDQPTPHEVWVVDASPSTNAAQVTDGLARQRVVTERSLAGTEEDRVRTTVFVGTPDASLEEASADADRVDRVRSEGATPLATALEVAAARIPRGVEGSIALVTDGLSTEPDRSRVLTNLSARGIPVHVLPVARDEEEIRVVGVDVPAPLRVAEEGTVHVDLVGRARSVQLSLSGPEGELTRVENVEVPGATRVELAFEPPRAGFMEITVRAKVIAGVDTRTDDNAWTRTIAVQDPWRVLYLGERVQNGARALGDALGGAFDITDAGDAALDPNRFSALAASADVVVLDDRPAAQLPDPVQRKLVETVQQSGVGLWVSGGGSSFGPGGYHETPLEEILPVEFVQKEEKKDPSTALAVIIDTSGSMGGNRIRLAKEVTRLAIKRLLPHDKVGIVEFYGAKRWAAPLQSAANAIDIQRALNRLDAGGGTVLFPAIEEAYYGLRNVQTRYKHVLMLTDAGVETGPYEDLLRRMARDGICVSTVLVGPERHSEFLVQLSDWGNGRFYNASDRFNLPEILLKQPSTARLPAVRPGRFEVKARGGRGWWGEVDPTGVPAVASYVETQARPGSEVILETVGQAHPVLASWRHGLGRVTTLTTEPTGPATAEWQSWDGYGATLARLMARTASDDRIPYRFRIDTERGQRVVTAERLDRAATPPILQEVLGDGNARGIPFELRADGVYRAEFWRDPSEEVRLQAGVEGRDARVRLVAPRGVTPEHQVNPAGSLALAEVARATGGRVLDASSAMATLPVGGRANAIGITRLAPPLALLALLTYLFEIYYRRRPASSWIGRPSEEGMA